MSKIPKISHELPINMLGRSFEINDYEYCLPHLLDQNPIYEEHFRYAREAGSYIVMDNSLHELGEAYNTDRLMYWIKELEPDEFIVPDVWQDKTQTIINARKWSRVELPEGTTKVAVVQANSYGEAYECYHILKNDLGYQKIAFSYGADWYAEDFPHPNPLVGKMMGRIMTISKMYKAGLIQDKDRVHLLGTASPIEFGLYKHIECIESIDTSNPIMAGIEQKMYFDLGLPHKPEANMNNFQDIEEKDTNLEFIEFNIRKFREINGL